MPSKRIQKEFQNIYYNLTIFCIGSNLEYSPFKHLIKNNHYLSLYDMICPDMRFSLLFIQVFFHFYITLISDNIRVDIALTEKTGTLFLLLHLLLCQFNICFQFKRYLACLNFPEKHEVSNQISY